jgi:O-acetyl-ADP-ribose deacetylase (regulator of RNase III)
MKVMRGDLLALAKAGHFDVIVHGCNCFCAMGNGIAGQVKKQFPAAFDADKATQKGDRAKLGTLTSAAVDVEGRRLVVVNAYTQYTWSKPEQVADYEAIRRCMRAVRANYAGLRIGVPRIGAGLAGGDWRVIAPIIDEELAGEDVTLVEYSPGA